MAYPKEIPVGNFTVKYTDIFHMKNLYKWLHELLVVEEWCTRKDDTFPETFYNQNEAGEGGTEIHIHWRLKKKINELNEFLEWRMKINFHSLFLKSIEIVKDGKKFKTNDGECELQFNCTIVTDPKDKWKNHKLLNQFFFPFFCPNFLQILILILHPL